MPFAEKKQVAQKPLTKDKINAKINKNVPIAVGTLNLNGKKDVSMRKIVSLLLCMLLMAVLCVSLTACQTCEHEYPEEATRIAEPTCTEDGAYYYACTLCGEEKKVAPEATDTAMLAKGHTSDAGTMTTQVSCTTDGVMVYTCTVCDATIDTVTVKTPGHIYDELDVQTNGSEHWYECEVCETVLEKGTCEYVLMAYSKTEHTTACKVCYYEKANARVAHDMDDGVLTAQATCYQNGYKTYTCADCGYTEREALPLVDHSYDETVYTYSVSNHWIACVYCKRVKEGTTTPHTFGEPVVTEPTATSCLPGTSVSTCTACGNIKTEYIASSAPHTMTTTLNADETLTRACTSCETSWTSAVLMYGDGTSSAGLGGNAGTGSGWGSGGLGPDVIDGCYVYEKNNAVNPCQAQFYLTSTDFDPSMPLPEEWTGALLSFKVKQGAMYMSDWGFYICNSTGAWSDNSKGFALCRTTNSGKNKKIIDIGGRAIGDISLGTDWVTVDIEITFDRENDKLLLVYYVNGVYVSKASTSNLLLNDMFNGIYFSSPGTADNTYNTKDPNVQPSIYFDDIILAVY